MPPSELMITSINYTMRSHNPDADVGETQDRSSLQKPFLLPCDEQTILSLLPMSMMLPFQEHYKNGS